MSGSPRVPRPLSAALALMLLGSCINPICGCSPKPARVPVSGRVTRPDGAPIAFATLNFQASSADCAEPFTSAGYPRTEADGRYSWSVIHDGEPGDGCIRVFATPPVNETGLRASDTVKVPVRFDYDPEPMRLDFVLRAR
jgi:hypothetical protein